MKKIGIISIASLLLIISIPSIVQAKRVLPHAKPATGTSSSAAKAKTTSSSKGVGTSVKFRGDRRAIVINFSNLAIASSVNYTLSYESRGIPQGAGGTIQHAGDSTSRELLFGTCSHGVCRYDTGIVNAKLVITTTLLNGKKVVKSYKLKV